MAPFVSYARNAEDVVLARALRPDERLGRWIDVGAGDPLVDSVTAAFSQRGWRGVNIEPRREAYERLVELRPDDVNLRVAAGAVDGIAKLYAGPPEARDAATLVAEIAERRPTTDHALPATEVEVTTLARVVDEWVEGPVDFLRIDTVGSEPEVIAGIDWATLQPRVIVVAVTHLVERGADVDAWERRLSEMGYAKALYDGQNYFYARRDDGEVLAALAAPASASDDFVPYRYRHALDLAEAEEARLVAELERLRGELRAVRAEMSQDDRWASLEAENVQLLDELRAAEESAATARAVVGELQARYGTELAAEREAIERLGAELQLIRNSKTMRWTRPLRVVYRAFKESADR
jgi:FkbM family methyltransferase